MWSKQLLRSHESRWIIYTGVFYFVIQESHATAHSIYTIIQEIIKVYTNKLQVKISLSLIPKIQGCGGKEEQRPQAQLEQNVNICEKISSYGYSYNYASVNTDRSNQELKWSCCDWWRWCLFKDDWKTGQEAQKRMLMCSNTQASAQFSVFCRTVLPFSNGGRNSPTQKKKQQKWLPFYLKRQSKVVKCCYLSCVLDAYQRRSQQFYLQT